MGYAFAKIGVKLRYLNSAETRRGEHSRVATKVAHDARKDWGGFAPFLDLPPGRSFASAPAGFRL
jgi:hypothetical protein